MKENAPKKIRFQTLRTLWVPLAIGVVTVAALAVVVGMVWKDYRTAMMDSQTRQMELVVQSTADSIRVLLEEYADRLDSIAGKAEASKAFRPTVARSDTIRDVWLENSNGEVIYSCYGLSAVCDVLITRTEDISYWQYHSGDEHYLVMKKKAGGETACLVVDSTVMYQQLISEIHVGRNGYIMIKNDDDLVVMHPEAVQWGIKVVEGRQRIYQGKELDMSSLSELLRAQQEEESGTLDYYSYWWADPDLPRVHKISAFRHLDVGGRFWIVSAVVDYDDFYEPVQQSFVKVVLIFGGVALVLVLFMFQMFRLQERDRRSATEISDLKTLNQTLEELHRSEESLAHGQRLQMMGTLTGGIAHEFNNFLTPITGYADLIMADADPGSEIYDNAMEISEAAQKAQEVVKQISSMSRKNVETVYDAVSVEGLLHRTRKLVETNCPKNVELKEENDGLQKKFKRLIIAGLLLIFLSCIIAIISEDVLHMEKAPMDAGYLLLISIAVFLFIYAGCSMDTYELLVDNETYRKKKHGNRYSWLYYVTLGCASILYVGLGMLFGKEAWRTGWILIAVTWLVTYGIVSGINMRKK